jgi:hypothetical protein
VAERWVARVVPVVLAVGVGCSAAARAPVTAKTPARVTAGPATGQAAVAVVPRPSVPKDRDDDEREYRRGRRRSEWYAGGRHPQWRGCRHTYQPELTAWIFSGSS